MKRLSLERAQALPVLSHGHFDNLIFKDESKKIWLSRMTKADGAPYNNQITVEALIDGEWKTIDQYEAR